MTHFKALTGAALIALLGASFSAQAYDADWKRGRVYYRSVCTSCHTAAPIGSINPSTKTKAEWSAYLLLDKHAKGKDKTAVRWVMVGLNEQQSTKFAIFLILL